MPGLWLVVLLVLVAADCVDETAEPPGGSTIRIPKEDPWGFIEDRAQLGEWDALADAAQSAVDDPDSPIPSDAALAVYAAALGHIETEEAASRLSAVKEEVEGIDDSQLPVEALAWLEQARDAVATLPSEELAPEEP